MKRYLLDVSALLAFLDPSHVHHDSFHRWIESKDGVRVILCAHVENAAIRIASNPKYNNWLGTSAQVRAMLIEFVEDFPVERCTRDVSLCDDRLLILPELLTPARVSDLYLLALAVANGAALATFDMRIPAEAVAGGPEALELIPVSLK